MEKDNNLSEANIQFIVRHCCNTIADAVALREKMIPAIDRCKFNKAILEESRRRHNEFQAREKIYWKCTHKGHIWDIYDTVGWELGYDSPVRCRRCGTIENVTNLAKGD